MDTFHQSATDPFGLRDSGLSRRSEDGVTQKSVWPMSIPVLTSTGDWQDIPRYLFCSATSPLLHLNETYF